MCVFFQGGTSIAAAQVLHYLVPATQRKYHLFDSFEGHPDYTKTKDKDFDLVQYSKTFPADIGEPFHLSNDLCIHIHFSFLLQILFKANSGNTAWGTKLRVVPLCFIKVSTSQHCQASTELWLSYLRTLMRTRRQRLYYITLGTFSAQVPLYRHGLVHLTLNVVSIRRIRDHR